MKQSLRRPELLLLAGLFAAGLLLLAVLLLTRHGGTTVQVRVDGVLTAEYPLSEDRTVLLHGVDGGTNLLVIENGTARLAEASCPDLLCVNMGTVRSAGQSIVCLPNRLVVEIVSAAEDAGMDTVVG